MDLEFTEEISHGAFGTVWLAQDVLIRRTYAVKFFDRTHPGLAAYEATAQASAMARVDSPYVVRLYAIESQTNPGTAASELAVVMEYVEGEVLEDARGPFETAHAHNAVRDLVMGVAAIHAAGIVHRDLWARNVIVTANGAKIFDLYDRGTGSKAVSSATLREDVRDLAGLVRMILERTPGTDLKRLSEAYFRASSARSLDELAAAVSELVPALRSWPEPECISSEPERPASTAGFRESTHPPAGMPKAASRTLALELLGRVQGAVEPLSTILPDILQLATRAGDDKLAALCESEITGYDDPGDEATQREPDAEIAHRVITFFIGQGVAINPNFFATGSGAMEYVRRHPDQFVRTRIMYSRPLVAIERLVSERPPKGLVVLRSPTSQGPGYADGDTFHEVIEALRARLAAHLIRISRGAE